MTKNRSDNPILQYFLDFGVLRETRREYWGIQIVNFLDCTMYFAMLIIVSLFLSHDLGMSDENAGTAIAIFTASTTLLLTFSGMMTDWLGIKTSLRVSMIGLLLLRIGVVVVGLSPDLPNRGWIAAALLTMMAPFMAGVQTVFQSAIKRFTTRRSRGPGFNMWYLFMNIGAASAGFAVDIVRIKLEMANVHIFSMGVVLAILCLVVNETMIHREEQLHGAEETPEPEEPSGPKKKPLEILCAVFQQQAFYRLLVLIALVLGVRSVFAYLYLLMPKYWERTIGADAYIGTLNAINPIGIVVGLILFIPFANKFRVFDLLVYGSMVSAVSLLPMAMPWDWFHQNIATAHYLMAFICMVLLTLGEILWSPKLNEYTAAIAPKGQEGTYLGLSLIPWFGAKTVVSLLSGHMLSRWCPEKVVIEGSEMPLQAAMIAGKLDYWDSPAAMWLVLGLWALAGCLLAWLMRHWLTQGVREGSQKADS